MNNLFDETRAYMPDDPEILALLGNKARQAQLRHYGRAPAYFRLGRKIVYHGADLNAWANARRVSSQEEG
jgi:hypothetical protein